MLYLIALATIIFQGWMAAGYHRKAEQLQLESEKLNAEAKTLKLLSDKHNSQAADLKSQVDRYNALPIPVVEVAQAALRDAGFTNVNCLVWGQCGNNTMGFMVDSNRIIPLPHMNVKMMEIDRDEIGERHKL